VPSGSASTRPGSREHRGDIDHLFHLAAIYDMSADDDANQTMNVEGTRHAIELAETLEVGCFHQVSSVAVAGEYDGPFDEAMFHEGQALASPYHRTKYESERIVREDYSRPWRVYRPAIVVGHSENGAMDKIDGPYYFFPVIKVLRDRLPAVVAVGRRRPRRHQRRSGRLRREGDGPPRTPRRTRR
jgi:thioester reductase-like protein